MNDSNTYTSNAAEGPKVFHSRSRTRAVELARAEEHFLALSTTVKTAAIENGKRVLLLTSAVRGEGKSFVAMNLGTNLAKLGVPTLLLDADLRAPCKYPFLRKPSSDGLLGFLDKGAPFAACVCESTVPLLSIIPSGGVSSAPLQAFTRSRMRDLVASLREFAASGVVLLDTPPGLIAPEVKFLTSFVDAALLVVAANRTPRSSVAAVLELLGGTSVLGIILNQWKPVGSGYRYYHPMGDFKPRSNGLVWPTEM